MARARRLSGRRLAVAFAVIAAAALAFLPIGGGAPAEAHDSATRPQPIDLSPFAATSPKDAGAAPIDLLFIHHSCGGQLFADRGPEKEWASCILDTHPNGGGLRRMLEAAGYAVHEASYGSEVGDATDMFDWLPKFRDRPGLAKVLTVDRDDTWLPPGRASRVLVFKSCFTQDEYVGVGEAPGDPRGPALTLWNAKATMTALLPELAKRPDVLFVYVTPPPQAPNVGSTPAWKWVAQKITGRPTEKERHLASARIARAFADWVVSKDGWLRDYAGKNVVVFDYRGVLTDGGASDFSRYAGGGGYDSHPVAEGNAKAAAAFVPFVNRAAHRAGVL